MRWVLCRRWSMFDGPRTSLESLLRVPKVDLILYNFICFVRSRFKEHDLIMLWSANPRVNILHWNTFMALISFWSFWCWSFLTTFWIVYCAKFLHSFLLWLVYTLSRLAIRRSDSTTHSDSKPSPCGSTIPFLLRATLTDVHLVFYAARTGFSDIQVRKLLNL